MKSTRTILFILLNSVFVINIYSQDYCQSDKKIDSLFMLIDNIVNLENITSFKDFEDSNKFFINENSLVQIKNLLYSTYSQFPEEFKIKRERLWEKWKANNRKGLSPNDKIDGVTIKIGEKYGWDYVEFLKTLYFLKVKVTQITHSKYPIKDSGRRRKITIGQRNVHCIIQDVLKGKENYSIGDSTIVVFLPIWFSETDAYPDFKVGNEYILPLDTWGNDPKNSLRLSLQGLHTFFEVKNDTVFTPLIPSFYQKGKPKSFVEFRKNFEAKYIQK